MSYLLTLAMLRKKLFFLKLLLVGLVISVVLTSSLIVTSAETADEPKKLESTEIREYEGKNLSSIDDFFENSIKGPRYIDTENYRLFVIGLVDNPYAFTYDEVVNNHQHFEKVVTLHCVEGWSVTILWEGIMLKELIADTGVYPNATVMIFYAEDGYSTSLPLDYIINNNIMIAYKMNNVTLPPQRGFPFQLVAESKWGYKWIKWITAIELSSNEEYRGYWERRGYSNHADLNEGYFDPEIPEFPSWIIVPLLVTVAAAIIVCRKKLSQKKAHQFRLSS